MRIAIATFDGFNEIDSFVALYILNRVRLPGWKAELVAPAESVASVNGVVVRAQRPLAFAREADAVLFGSGRLSRQWSEDPSILAQLAPDPSRQLVGSQCSGALFLHRLGLLQGMPACADATTRPLLEEAGVATLSRHFNARGNVATAGGCLASPCLAAWVIARMAGTGQAADALRYVAPVGREDAFVQDVLDAIAASAQDDPEARTSSADARQGPGR